ncbi:response regulator [Neorhizobium sp. P12A]|uniref:response regulator n=1 Tax=Neorhizobium sp. P12A TaxID=2268027 RepID=UPI0011ECEC98|nr:response regulator [Neorhizobium sp. P12A]KAA0695569.1 response regulator [Neorhizobium sp. P12A]
MQVQFIDTLDHTIQSNTSGFPDDATRDSARGPIRFGRFCALPHSRELLRDGRRLEIGGRAFDLLMVLLRSNGGIVSKDEILNEVWPSMVVEECNLRFQIKSLRRTLGNHGYMIKTIVRRGYMLVRDECARENIRLDRIGSLTPPKNSAWIGKSGDPNIVLIEDDESVRGAISSLLRSIGLSVAAFASVGAYVDNRNCDHPDCLILDACLPGRNGLDFQADLIKAGNRFPIIFISGHADVQMSVRAMKAGAIEFLTKPVRHQDLLGAVAAAIDAQMSATS